MSKNSEWHNNTVECYVAIKRNTYNKYTETQKAFFK